MRGLYVTDGCRQEIAIGQGWRGKSFEGLGIGNCCAGAACALRGCPPTAAEVARFLRENG